MFATVCVSIILIRITKRLLKGDRDKEVGMREEAKKERKKETNEKVVKSQHSIHPPPPPRNLRHSQGRVNEE